MPQIGHVFIQNSPEVSRTLASGTLLGLVRSDLCAKSDLQISKTLGNSSTQSAGGMSLLATMERHYVPFVPSNLNSIP